MVLSPSILSQLLGDFRFRSYFTELQDLFTGYDREAGKCRSCGKTDKIERDLLNKIIMDSNLKLKLKLYLKADKLLVQRTNFSGCSCVEI